jgi:hypothetical protein
MYSIDKKNLRGNNKIIDVERIKIGKRPSIDTLISEEALLFAKYLRDERKDWIPRLSLPSGL